MNSTQIGLVLSADEADVLIDFDLVYFDAVPEAADAMKSDTSLGWESMGTWLLTITSVCAFIFFALSISCCGEIM